MKLAAAQCLNVVNSLKTGEPLGKLTDNVIPFFCRNTIERRFVMIPLPRANLRD